MLFLHEIKVKLKGLHSGGSSVVIDYDRGLTRLRKKIDEGTRLAFWGLIQQLTSI